MGYGRTAVGGTALAGGLGAGAIGGVLPVTGIAVGALLAVAAVLVLLGLVLVRASVVARGGRQR